MNINKAKLVKLSTDDQALKLVGGLLAVQAKSELTRQTVDAYIDPIFQRFEFFEADNLTERRSDRSGNDKARQRITEIKNLYVTDLKSEQYKTFVRQCDDAHRAGPFASMMTANDAKYPKNGDDQRFWCPALIVESAYRDLKNQLADWIATEWLGLESINFPHSHKLVELVTGLVLSGPRGSEIESKKVLKSFASA